MRALFFPLVLWYTTAMKKATRTIEIGVIVLAVLVFGLWLYQQETVLSVGTAFALVSLSLFALTLTASLTRFVRIFTKTEPSSFSEPDTMRIRLSAWGLLLVFGLTVTLFQYIAVYLIADPGTTFQRSFRFLYYRSDVAHYMAIARDWYVPEGDERLRLVFLPLYPLAVRAFTLSVDYFWGAFTAAQVFSLLCLPAAYELFRLDTDRRGAMTCARILFLLPGAAFLRVPMSEGLFLLVTLLAVYFARRERFILAGLFTALSAFTRSLGILLLGLLFIEMLLVFLREYKADRSRAFRLLPRCAVGLLLGCCGTLAYLAVSWTVSGSPFTFLTYQRENWNQRLGLFFNTAAYQIEYGLMYLQNGDMKMALSLSLPNLLCGFAVLGLLYADRKRMRLSYLLWSLVYFALSMGATWLLSGPRYLAMVFPLALTLHQPGRRKAAELGLEAALLLSQTAYLLMLALDMSVY